MSPLVEDCKRLTDNAKGGWVLQVETSEAPSFRYAVSCLKNEKLENPSASEAAVMQFYSNGKPSGKVHYSSGRRINPIDGSPAQVNYTRSGEISNCWYMTPHGTYETNPATGKQIAKRMAAGKNAVLQTICAGSQDIVALKSISPHVPQSASFPPFIIVPN